MGTFISRCCELIIKSSLYIIAACLKFWNGSFRALSDYVYDVKSLEQQLLIQKTSPGLNINLSLWISAASKVNTLLRKYFEKVWKWLFAEDVGGSLVERFGGRRWLTVAGGCSCWLCDVWCVMKPQTLLWSGTFGGRVDATGPSKAPWTQQNLSNAWHIRNARTPKWPLRKFTFAAHHCGSVVESLGERREFKYFRVWIHLVHHISAFSSWKTLEGLYIVFRSSSAALELVRR